MKTFAVAGLTTIALAISFAAEAEPDVAALEAGYKTASENLKTELTEALTHEDVRKSILEPLWKANKAMSDASVATVKAFKMKGEPVHLSDEAELRIDNITERPPFLRQDVADLYNRYRSAVVINLSSYGKDGRPMSSKDYPYDVTIAVAADPQIHWNFPTTAEALQAIGDRVLEAAKGRFKMAEESYQRVIDYKRAKA